MKEKKTIMILILVLTVGIVGLTIAYFSNNTNILNEFKTKPYGTTVTEEFVSPDNWLPGDTTNKEIKVVNSGKVDEAVRISYTETWTSKNGTILSGLVNLDGNLTDETKNSQRAAIINFVNENDWTKKGDYYYYNYKLAPNEETSSLIQSVTFNKIVKNSSNCVTDTSVEGVRKIKCTSDGDGYDDATYKLKFIIETIQYNKYDVAWDTNVDIIPERPKKATEELIDKVDSEPDDDLVKIEHNGITEYRYIGDNPKNYVKFNCDEDGENCEIWRIIGVVDVERSIPNPNQEEEMIKIHENRIKLVRGNAFSTKMNFGSNASNNWVNNSLKIFLNTDYYNRTGNASNYGLKESARDMILDAKYYLGGGDTRAGTPESMYTWEHGTNVPNGNSTEWIGKVGLMYPSDNYFTYIDGVSDICYNDASQCNVYEEAIKSWIISSNIRDGQTGIDTMWLISPRSDIANNPYTLGTGLLGDAYAPNTQLGIRPVVYLSPDIKILSGTGEEDNPYVFDKIYWSKIKKADINPNEPAASQLVNNALNETYSGFNKKELFAINHSGITEYRYIGDNPSNYVKFNCDEDGENCEIWRMIGVFEVDRLTPDLDNEGKPVSVTEQRIKLVRGSALADKRKWSNNATNNWLRYSLKLFLNDDYYNGTGEAATYGLKKSAREMIADAKYYLGGSDTNSGTPMFMYNWEHGTNVPSDNTTEWLGKIGLMYPSDNYFAYSNGVNYNCFTDASKCRYEDDVQYNWLTNSNTLEGSSGITTMWLISPKSNSSFNAFTLGGGTLSDAYAPGNQYGVRPVLYLSADTRITSGTGEEENPYMLAKGISDEIQKNNINPSEPAVNQLMSNAINQKFTESNKSELFVMNHNDTTDYRYLGNEPNNYVDFNCDENGENCETWRIIGIFDVEDENENIEKRIKLVRGGAFASKKTWHYGASNNWLTSYLKTFLNGDYYNRTGEAATYGLTESAQNMIKDAKFYLGGLESEHGTPEVLYGYERGTVVASGNSTEWTGKVGLLYASDNFFTYADGVNYTCYNDAYNCGTLDDIKNSWIYNSNILDGETGVSSIWLISAPSYQSFNAATLGSKISNAYAPNSYLGVRPVVYLKANVKIISGDGSSVSHYKLSL